MDKLQPRDELRIWSGSRPSHSDDSSGQNCDSKNTGSRVGNGGVLHSVAVTQSDDTELTDSEVRRSLTIDVTCTKIYQKIAGEVTGDFIARDRSPDSGVDMDISDTYLKPVADQCYVPGSSTQLAWSTGGSRAQPEQHPVPVGSLGDDVTVLMISQTVVCPKVAPRYQLPVEPVYCHPKSCKSNPTLCNGETPPNLPPNVFSPGATSSNTSWNAIRAGKPLSVPGNTKDCDLSIDKVLVVNLPSRFALTLPIVELQRCRSAYNEHGLSVEVIVRDEVSDMDIMKSLLKGSRVSWKAEFSFSVTPREPGTHTILLRQPGNTTLLAEYTLTAVGEEPVLSFNDGTDWPIAVAVDDTRRKRDDVLVYVAYGRHITEFLGDGRFVQRLVHLKDEWYNDVAVAPHCNSLVASVSMQIRFDGELCRTQKIHVYNTLSGRKLYTVGERNQTTPFTSPVLTLANKDIDHIVFVDGDTICELNVTTGKIDWKLTLKEQISVSSISYLDDRYYVTDTTSGEVKIYYIDGSREGEILDPEPIESADQKCGLRAIVTDPLGNVFTSDCFRDRVILYSKDGSLLKEMGSRTQLLKWPLSLATEATEPGNLYVVDHGNVCVNKFRYM